MTPETKEMVLDNIRHLLNNFLHCTAYENIIFCWVMHGQEIIDSILDGLDTQECRVCCISLIADEATVRARLQKDVEMGLRQADVIERSVARIPLYERLDTVRIDTDGKTAWETAEEICRINEEVFT